MSMNTMTATKLRLILVASMAILLTLAVVLFAFGFQKIKEHSVSTRAVAAEAQASNSSVQNLINIKKQLEVNKDAIQRASLIVSESKSYIYQDQIIQDINRFANSAGITITNISFSDTGTIPTSSTTTTAPTATPAVGKPAGIKTTTATVTVKNPVDYNKMLAFIHSIEDSLFKMRISQVSLSKPTDAKSPNEVASDVLTIEVYLR